MTTRVEALLKISRLHVLTTARVTRGMMLWAAAVAMAQVLRRHHQRCYQADQDRLVSEVLIANSTAICCVSFLAGRVLGMVSGETGCKQRLHVFTPQPTNQPVFDMNDVAKSETGTQTNNP
jgi:hypothetical protein